MLSERNGDGFTGRESGCAVDCILKDRDGLCPGYAIPGIVPDRTSA